MSARHVGLPRTCVSTMMAPHCLRRVLCVAVIVLLGTITMGVHAEEAQSDAEFEPFLQWFKDIGGVANGVGLKRFPGMGTGVLATHDVSEDDVVLSVPMKWVVCRDMLNERDDAVSVAVRSIKADDDMVAAWLMAQRFLGVESAFQPYIEALPTHVPLPNTFSKNELAMFEDKRFVRSVRKRQRNDARRLERVVVPALRQAFPAASGDRWEDATSLASYHWAFNLVGSRALTIRGRKYLVPFADMYNYEPHAEERAADSGANFLKYHRLGTERFDIVADRSAKAGQQLFEDYGDNTNELYVNHHGFVAANNPFDCVSIRLPPIRPRSGQLGRDKRRLLEAMRVNINTLDTCSRANKPFSYALHVYMAVALMDSKSIEQCRDIINGARDRGLLGPCFGAAYAAQDLLQDDGIRDALTSAIQEQLNGYSTTIAQDRRLEAASGDSALSDHERIAVAFRRTRKELLQGLLNVLQPDSAAAATAVGDDDAVDGGDGIAEVAVEGDGTPVPYTTTPHVTDRVRTDEELRVIVDEFNAWMAASQPPVAAIEATWIGNGMRVGVKTTRDIPKGEVYLAVPNDIIMSRASARGSPHLEPLFKRLDAQFPKGDAFHELLIHLMYEAFVLGHRSKFAPYLNIIPNKAEIGGPAFWTSDELAEVQGSVSLASIQGYNGTMQRRFAAAKRAVFDNHKDLLPPDVFILENYRWAYGILDSRSIWWQGERHLVPLLDLINCVEGPDPEAIHSTVLDDSGNNAITRAAWDFGAGDQLFENYGQPNHIYFEYHGFALESNTHDCVQVPGFNIPDDLPNREEVLQRFGRYGIRDGGGNVLCVNVDKPSDIVKGFLATVHKARSNSARRAALRPYLQAHLDRYDTSIAEDEALLADNASSIGGVGSHVWNAVQYRLSEKRLLHAGLQ